MNNTLIIVAISPNGIPLYRYVGPHGHFYTTSADEIGTTTPKAVGKHGLVSEGVICEIFSTKITGTVPLYRYASAISNHFYTTNWKETGAETQGAVVGQWANEGIMGYVYSTKQPGTCALYRYVQVGTGRHFYTVYSCEIGVTTPGAVGRHNFKSEGIQCYVLTSAFPCEPSVC